MKIRTQFLHLLGCAGLLLAAGQAHAVPTSNSDLFDVSNGTQVTASSEILSGFSVDTIFGAVDNGPLAYFADGQAAGTTNFIEWETAGTVTLQSIVLNAFHDGAASTQPDSGTSAARGFDSFSFFAFNDSTQEFDLVFSLTTANVYGDTMAPDAFSVVETNAAGNLLSVAANFNAVTSGRFRAEFVQAGGMVRAGARILEIDGFSSFNSLAASPSSAIPEPGSLALFALGALGLLRYRRRQIATA